MGAKTRAAGNFQKIEPPSKINTISKRQQSYNKENAIIRLGE